LPKIRNFIHCRAWLLKSSTITAHRMYLNIYRRNVSDVTITGLRSAALSSEFQY